jgi:protochlorophyllide reductase
MARWTAADIPDLTGRTAVVTGANAGLGLEIARRLAVHGASVVLACRNLAKAQAAATSIRTTTPGAQVSVEQLDLADLSSIAAFAQARAAAHGRLDLLINNAGLMAVDESRTVDGFEMQLGVNHLGHFALTARLLPLLQATPGSRVATMSSMGHRRGRLVADDLMFDRRGYQRWNAYFQSKLANLLFTAELQRRLSATGASTVAVTAHPGASRTDLGTEGRHLSNRMMGLAPALAQPAEVGALGMLRAATALDVVGGQFYGPRFVALGYPVLETPSRRAQNMDDARRLWDLSADLVGLHPLVPAAA